MVSKKRHVWIFYNLDYARDDYVPESYSELIYAYTTKKHLAEEFMLTRNMKIFLVKEFHLSSSELNELYKERMSANLEQIEVEVKQDDRIKKILLPVTMEEARNARGTYDTILYHKLLKYSWYHPDVFKMKYFEVLTNFRYVGFYNYITGIGMSFDEDVETLISPNYLNILLDMYGDYFMDTERSD